MLITSWPAFPKLRPGLLQLGDAIETVSLVAGLHGSVRRQFGFEKLHRFTEEGGNGLMARFVVGFLAIHQPELGLSRNHAVETQCLLGLFAQGLRREALPDP